METPLLLDVTSKNNRVDWTKVKRVDLRFKVTREMAIFEHQEVSKLTETRANFGSNSETCESLRVELLHASTRMLKLALIAKLSAWKYCSVL